VEVVEFEQRAPWCARTREDDGPTQRVIMPRAGGGTGRGRGACRRKCGRKWRTTRRRAMDRRGPAEMERNRVRNQDGGYGLA